MKLVRLTIRSLPGLDRPLQLEPDPDRVCIVLGPNASGKSSLLRALTMLLDPQPQAAALDIEAEFIDGEQRVQGRALGPSRSWLRDGAEAERPDWPASAQIPAYLVQADALGAAGQPETEFSQALRRVMAGGYDLDELAASPELSLPARPQKLARSLREADEAIAKLEGEQAELARALDGIDALRARREHSIEAARKLASVDRASELLATERAIASLQETLAAFPAGMDRLDGSESERLDQIGDEAKRLARDLDEQRHDREQAFEAAATNGVDDPDAAATFSTEIAELRQSLIEAERRLAELGERVATTEADVHKAAARAGGLTARPTASLAPERLETLERAADRLATARLEREQVERNRARHAEQAPDADELADTETAVRALRAWLRVPAPTPAAWATWSLLLTLVCAASAWLWVGEQRFWPAVTVAVAAALPLVQLLALSMRALRTRRVRINYPAYAIEPPARWRPAEVSRRLDVLERAFATLLRRRADAERARDLGIEIAAVTERVDQARAALEGLARELGLNPEAVVDAAGRLRLRALADWRAANDRLESLRREAAGCQRAIGETQQALTARFQRAGHAPPQPLSSEALGSWLRRFDQRVDKACAARERARAAERSIGRLERSIRDVERNRLELLERAGAASGDDLRRRLTTYAEYRARRDELRGLEHARLRQRTDLDDHPELRRSAEAGDEQGLDALRASLKERAAERDPLGERIATLESEHRTALRERRLEALGAERERLRAELERSRQQRLETEGAALLIERARAGFGRDHQPRLLRRAASLFARMTRARFELRFDGAVFGALDARSGLKLGLAELSTATRIQLLLALRLAWIERAERGGPDLPLFLDEVLATTDPDRYRSVVEAVQELVREGRQVIYLSSQPADAQAWQRFAGEPAPAVIALAPPGSESFDFELPAEGVPPDASMPAAQWARAAGVPPLDPWAAPESVSLFHLLRDDRQALTTLFRWGVRTVGEFEHARSVGLRLPLNGGQAERLAARARAVRAWLRRWRHGHAPPVDDADLQDSEAVSEAFFDSVSKLNRELGGDAKALLAALRDGRVPRFRSAQADKLEAHLAGHGKLDERSPPAEAELIEAMAFDGGDDGNDANAGLDADEAARLHGWLQAARTADA